MKNANTARNNAQFNVVRPMTNTRNNHPNASSRPNQRALPGHKQNALSGPRNNQYTLPGRSNPPALSGPGPNQRSLPFGYPKLW